MKVKELKKVLAGLDENKEVLIATDEEINTTYKTLQIVVNAQSGAYIIYGITGTEI